MPATRTSPATWRRWPRSGSPSTANTATATWEDYPILRFSEVPEIEIRFIDAPDEPALGLGEVGMGPTVAAIGNAVARALGARIRNLPLTRERIMATLLADNEPA